jgi:hypothetical protein
VTKIESRDVDFIEDDFPTRGKVDRNLELYETLDQEEGALSGLVENEEEILQTLRDSGNDLPPSGSISVIPYKFYRFKIEFRFFFLWIISAIDKLLLLLL